MADQLPGLCAGLHAGHSVGAVAAQRLLGLAWEWIGQDIETALVSSRPSYRDEELTGLGKPLASVLTAAAAIGAGSTLDTVSLYIRQQEDAVTALEMSALRAAAELRRDGTPADAGFGGLAVDCAARLRARLAHPQRAPATGQSDCPRAVARATCAALSACSGRPGPADIGVAARQAAQAACPLSDRRR